MYAIIPPASSGAGIRYASEPAIVGKGHRCLPVTDIRPDPLSGETLEDPVVTVEKDRVSRTWTARPKTLPERLADMQAARRAAYPSLGDQLDALFKARAGDPTELAAIDAHIAAVKAANPKPTA